MRSGGNTTKSGRGKVTKSSSTKVTLSLVRTRHSDCSGKKALLRARLREACSKTKQERYDRNLSLLTSLAEPGGGWLSSGAKDTTKDRSVRRS